MTKKAYIIDVLSEILTELEMKPTEYAVYANERYKLAGKDKITSDRVWAFRSGTVQARIADIIKKLSVDLPDEEQTEEAYEDQRYQ